MNPWIVLVQFVIGFGLCVYLIWPLLVRDDDHFPLLDDLAQESRKNKVLEALRDLEYEHETGKLSDEDYHELREHYLNRATRLFDDNELDDVNLQTAESEDDISNDIEERIAQHRESLK
jgi:hypothetical protein